MSRHPIAPLRLRRSSMARTLAALAVATALSGCYSDREITASYPTDVRERHPISIREGERTVEIFIGTGRGTLTPAQRADVVAFAQAWQREATGGIIIDAPAGTSNGRAAADVLHEIRSLLAGAGVPADAIVAHSYRPADPIRLATIRLNYPKMVAEAGPCGIWPEDLGPSIDSHFTENRPYWNLGCANQRNLAAMVDNPADLVQPRGDEPSYAARRSYEFDKYRKGESTATVYPNENKGKISELGQ